MSNNQQVHDDEKVARELQQAELGQAGAGDAQFAYGAPNPIQYGYGGPPVVQGMPVPAAGAAQGVPVTGSVPTAGRYAGRPLGASVVVDENAVIELTVLRYRFSVMCFAFIDIFFTVFRISQAIADYYLIKEDSTYSSSFKTWDSPTNIWWLGLLGLVFLIGPLCGYVGAKGLRRNLVTIYLVFCACNMAYDIALAVIFFYTHIWFLFTAIIQLWITKIVFNFWRALGLLSQDRCAELLKPDYTPNEPVRLVYW